jgi:hypothetical protein
VRWSGSRTSATEFLDFALQISSRAFEHGLVMGIPTLLELLQHAAERQAKVLSFAKPVGGFPCQTWLFGCASSGSLVLLCLDRLALPASGHELSIAFRSSGVAIFCSATKMRIRRQRSISGRIRSQNRCGEENSLFPGRMSL